METLDSPPSNRPEDAVRIAGSSLISRRTNLTIFQLGSELLGVDAAKVQEVTLMARLSTPRGLPPVLAGFLNLAHRLIPVIWLHRLLGLPEPELGLYTQILILRDPSGPPVGWIVDRVVQIIPFRREDLLPVPPDHCFRDGVTGLFPHDGSSVSILAPERLLLARERDRILDFQAREEGRLRELGIGEE